MDLDGPVEIIIDVNGDSVPDPPAPNYDVGDAVSFKVKWDADSLTGFFDAVLDFDHESEVTTRLEQPATYSDLAEGDFTC